MKPLTDTHTVAFLDLTRFTALTDTHGDRRAVDVIDRFTEAVRAELAGRGRVVKSLGDGLLLDLAGPAAAIAVADGTSRRLHAMAGMPDFTGGIATGPAVDRDGDLLGSTVNLAARLADLAPPGELRVTDAVARAAAVEDWQVEPLGPTEIRGFHEPVLLYRVVLCHPSEHVTDPVCGMQLTPGPGTPARRRADATIYFCSPACAERFDTDPDRYLPTP